MFRPTAGMLAFFVHPTRGAAQSVKNIFSGKHAPTGVLASPRLYLAKEAASKLPAAEKNAMMDRLKQLEKDAKKRAKERGGGRVFLLANKREREEEKVNRERERAERAARKAVDAEKRMLAERRASETVSDEGQEGERDVEAVEGKAGSKGVKRKKDKTTKAKRSGAIDPPDAEASEGVGGPGDSLRPTTTRDSSNTTSSWRRYSGFGHR